MPKPTAQIEGGSLEGGSLGGSGSFVCAATWLDITLDKRAPEKPPMNKLINAKTGPINPNEKMKDHAKASPASGPGNLATIL